MLKNGQTYFKLYFLNKNTNIFFTNILFKVCLAIFQNYTWNGETTFILQNIFYGLFSKVLSWSVRNVF